MRRILDAFSPSVVPVLLLLCLSGCGGGGEPELTQDESSVSPPAEVPAPESVEASVPKPVQPLPEFSQVAAGAEVLATLPVGKNPQQIAFSPDGATAYVAAGRSNRVTLIDAKNLLVSGSMDAAGIPVGVGVLPESGDVLVSAFKDGAVARLDRTTGKPTGRVETGAGSSMLAGPFLGEKFLVAAERDKRVSLIDGATMKLLASFPTAERPFPPAVTSDGKLGFLASFMDGTVTVIDLERKMLQTLFHVGQGPSGLAVLPGDEKLAVALWEENRVAIIDIKTRREVQNLQDGIGLQPLSVVVSPDGRLAFVNNRMSNDISVIRLPELSVVERVKVGEIPSAMAVHPTGETLWVSCEGDHQLYVLAIPSRWTDDN